MKTVLFATRTVADLAPLTEASCLALLDVACKPLIVHTVESLAMAGLTDVMVVVSPDAYTVEAVLGEGARWGMRFEYVLATAQESEERTIERIRHKLGDEYLSVRGEILRTAIIAEFVERARSIESRLVVATIAGIEAGVRLVRGEATPGAKSPNDSANPGPFGEGEIRIDFPQAHLSPLDSLLSFYRANLDILAGHFAGLIIPGREIAPRVRVGRHTKLPASAIKEGPLLIGSRCSIADDAELHGEVAVSHDVVIDCRAMIRSSVIMPNTYIGELVEVTNAIVAGNRLIHVDTGTVSTVVDSFLLASIRSAEIGAWLRDCAERAVGAALLVVSLCLWPIALIAAVSANPRKPFRSRLLVGNRKSGSESTEFEAYEFATSVPLLRHLPYLLAVASGHLSLVGVEPLEAESAAARTEEWERVRDEGKVGLFGPVQLTASYDAPEEERRIIEAGYASTPSIVEDLKWTLRAVAALTTGRAWRSTVPSAAPTPGSIANEAGFAKFASDSRIKIESESFAALSLTAGEPGLQRGSLGPEEGANSLS
jgi:mannose-1-phosphate guanylyltransferase/phosphomannomutase